VHIYLALTVKGAFGMSTCIHTEQNSVSVNVIVCSSHSNAAAATLKLYYKHRHPLFFNDVIFDDERFMFATKAHSQLPRKSVPCAYVRDKN